MTTETEVRRLLKRTWFPFFGRFGRLTEVQVRSIPLIIRGRNVVVISPSASGKTEAVTAPVIERLLQVAGCYRSCVSSVSVLYVSPTRALVNDLHRRLCEPMEYLGLDLARKTGDHPEISESRLPFMLLTTPESLDSLLCRHTSVFAGLAAVILDELHLLDNTPRGDQLRVLLERLRLINSRAWRWESGVFSSTSKSLPGSALAKDSEVISDSREPMPGLQCCALSATIDDTNIGQRYFPDPVVVQVDACREIENVLLPMREGWHERTVAELRSRGLRKVLCFFNSRSWAESSAGLLAIPPFANRVWVHHASLTRKVREEVEARMNQERIGILCCTSTLELGIDIGDIDAVVLVRPPFNVSSLLQRVGRGNRRKGTLFMLGTYADAWERFLFQTFLECCRLGRLCEKRYTPALSVIPQQVASYLLQRRRVGTTLPALRRVLSSVFGTGGAVEQTFHHLCEQGVVVEQRSGIYYLGPKLERQVEYGKIHSNIQDKSFGKYEVCDAETNRHLGTVFYVFRTFMLGGRAWEVVEFREKESRVMVRPFQDVGATTKVFEGTGTAGYGYRLAQVLKSRLFPDLAADEFPWFDEGRQRFLVHLLGPLHGFLLSEAFVLEGRQVADLDGKLFSFPATKTGLSRFPIPEMSSIRQVVRKNITRLQDNLGSGAFFRLLPAELQVEDHLLALDVAGLIDFLGSVKPVELAADEVRRQMKAQLETGDEAPADD
ncbi:MAG: DEAD/DEAH box helicase [candidate division WOR-3 bacterium]